MKHVETAVLAGLLAVGVGMANDISLPAVDEGAELATHKEIEPLAVKFSQLSTLRLSKDNEILAGDAGAKCIKVLNSEGQVLRTIDLSFAVEAIAVADDGTVYAGGGGTIVQLDAASGKTVAAVDVPSNIGSDTRRRKRPRSRGHMVSGLTTSDKYLFVTFGSGWSTSAKAKLFRFTRDLKEPKVIREGLHGCCQRCDLLYKDNKLYVAENGLYRVLILDDDGKELSKWGEKSRSGLEGFGSCCNPMNMFFGKDGILYTAESGLGRVKKYTQDGKYLELVGYAALNRFNRGSGLAAACSNMALVAPDDGARVFIMDYKNKMIRVLEKK